MKILHITVHLGAGAGKAIGGMAIADKTNTHRIVILDQPQKMDHINDCINNKIEVLITPSVQQIREEVVSADVVIVNWWHHPLLYKILYEISSMSSRMILWSHVNGLYYPQLNYGFITCFDACLFTSKISLENKLWDLKQLDFVRSKSTLVYGMGNFHPEDFLSKDTYHICKDSNIQAIKVGYTGTIDYSKIHPDFLKWFKKVIDKHPEVRFEMAGDASKQILQDVERLKLTNNVIFLGFRKDIKELLSTWDVFVYPLNPKNFATTENALIEAMASGLPIVASSGDAEKNIITHDKNGLLARDEEEFAYFVERIITEENLRSRLGHQARLNAIATYSIEDNVERFKSVMNAVMLQEKSIHDFKPIIGDNPFGWFICGCNAEDSETLKELANVNAGINLDRNVKTKIEALDDIYKNKSKGSIEQYYRFFPDNEKLKKLVDLINICRGDG